MIGLVLTLALANGPLVLLGGPPDQVRPLLAQLDADPDVRVAPVEPCPTLDCMRQRIGFADLGVFVQAAPMHQVLVMDSTGEITRRVTVGAAGVRATVRAALNLQPRKSAIPYATPNASSPSPDVREPPRQPPPGSACEDPWVIAGTIAGLCGLTATGCGCLVAAEDPGDCSPGFVCSNVCGACVSGSPLLPLPEAPRPSPVAKASAAAMPY